VIQHRILKEKYYAYVEVKGTPSLADFIAASMLLVRDPHYSAGLNRICDLSQANLSGATIDDLVQYVDFAKKNIPLNRNTRVAIVAPDEARSGIFHSFATLIDRGNFRIFYNPLDATKWVQTRPEYFREDGTFCKVLGGVA